MFSTTLMLIYCLHIQIHKKNFVKSKFCEQVQKNDKIRITDTCFLLQFREPVPLKLKKSTQTLILKVIRSLSSSPQRAVVLL